MPRPGWPEAAPFVEWGRAPCAFGVLDRLDNPADVLAAVKDVLAQPQRPKMNATEIEEAAAVIFGALGGDIEEGG
jgi:hypothetical protein